MGLIEHAARVDDPIAHTDTDYAFGLSFAVVVAGAVLVPFGVGSVMLFASSASFAMGVGGRIDAALPENTDEKIKEGAATVFVGEDRQPAAKAAPATTVTQHGGNWVCTGSDVVFIELANASRRKDFTTCGGTIISGDPTVFYGGERVLAPGAVIGDEIVGTAAFRWYQTVLTVVPYLALPQSFWGGVLYGASALTDMGLTHEAVGEGLFAEGVRSRGWALRTAILNGLGR